MSAGEIAGLIAAVAFVALVALIAVPLLKLGRVLEEMRVAVHDIGAESVPILTELQGTVRAINEELGKLGTVTDDVATVSGNAASVTENAAQMSTLFTLTFGTPMIKAAAFTSGVRKVLRRSPGTDLDVADRTGARPNSVAVPRRSKGRNGQ
jgi:uncharacterized protein YoxC